MSNKIEISRALADLLFRALNGGSNQLTGMEHGAAFRELRALISKAEADGALTDEGAIPAAPVSYVHHVPDHCDRVVWRGSYHHLPIAAPVVERQGVTLPEGREMRIYIAGPMTGISDYNFPAFNAMADHMRAAGWHVENPADHGVVDGAEWADYLRYDIGRLSTCEAMMLLPGWSSSRGARLEASIAKELGVVMMLADGAEREPSPPAPVSQYTLTAEQFEAIEALLKENPASQNAALQDLLARAGRWDAPVAAGYVQPVPEHCDRIIWRGHYYGLPFSAQESSDAAKAFAKGFNTLETVDGKYKIVMQFAGRDDAWAAYTALSKLTASLAKPL